MTPARSARVRRVSLPFVVLLVLLASVPGEAVAGEPREGDQIWGVALLQGGFGFVDPKLSRVRGWLEVQGRWRGFGESLEAALLPRVGLGYAITDQVTVHVGYASIYTDPPQQRSYTEDRPWEQLTWIVPFETFTLQSRTRLEQRIHADNLGWRLREFVKATVPVPGFDRAFFAAYDELFFDLDDTSWGQRSGFRQNRAFVGLGYKLDPGKHVTLEAGYLNQWLDRRNEDRDNHVLSLNLFLNY